MGTVSGKLIEMVIKNRIKIHLEDHDVIETNQHRFCKGNLCVTNLLQFFQHVDKVVGTGEPVDIIYLVFQKASKEIK